MIRFKKKYNQWNMVREVIQEIETGPQFKHCVIINAVTHGGQRLNFLFRQDGSIISLDSELARNIAAHFNVGFTIFRSLD